MSRLVFGFAAVMFYTMKSPERIKKMLECFDNDFLVTTMDLSYKRAETIAAMGFQHRCYLDSGGFTLFRKQTKFGADSPEFQKECKSMARRFLKLCEILKPKECFELDNDYFKVNDDLLSPDNFLRQQVYDILGYYPTPVFKLHQGIAYWKALCEDDRYPRLAIGGLAQTRSWHLHTDLLKQMMDYARLHGKKVHLLGCQNVQAFKEVQPDTVDYNIWQYAINLQAVKNDIGKLRGMSKEEITAYRPHTWETHEHMVLYGLARAKARSFLYDAFMKSQDDNLESDA